MSISDTRALFGDTISGTVKSSSGSVWNSCTFSYIGSVASVSVSGMNLAVNDFANNVSQFPDYAALLYSCPVSDVASYYDFILDIPVYFPDYALGAIGISNMLDGHDWSGITQSGNVVSSYPDNYYSGFDAVVAREPSSVYGAYHYDNTFYRLFPYLVDSNGEYLSSLHVQSVRSYAVNYQPAVLMMIFCPNVGSQPSNTEPLQSTTTDVTTTDNSAGTTVIVDVDMTETNSLLGQIKQAILGIVEGITNALKDLFIPDEEFLDDFKEDMLGTDQEPGFLEEHLGGLYQAIEAIGRIFDEFPDAVAATTIDIPACQIPLAGETLTLGPYSVPLIVEGLPQIFYDGLKFIIDFLCVAAFLNMCRNKLEIFLNPDSEVVQNDS